MSPEAPALSRKQREIAQRENLFLTIGRQIMHEQGFNALTMEMIAEQAEYSKGTVYQHFNCKEEIVGRLCVRSLTGLNELAQRAAAYPGSDREKIMAFAIAHDLWQQLEPRDVVMMQLLNTESVVAKISDATLEEQKQLEQSVLGTVCGFIDNAMESGQIPDSKLSSGELVYGMWSMCYGGQVLRGHEDKMVSLGVAQPGDTILTMLQLVLDGLKWKPRPSPAKAEQLITYCREEYFSSELNAIAQRTATHPTGVHHD